MIIRTIVFKQHVSMLEKYLLSRPTVDFSVSVNNNIYLCLIIQDKTSDLIT